MMKWLLSPTFFARYAGEANDFICCSPIERNCSPNSPGTYVLSSTKADAIIAPAEASLSAFGILGASKSQYGILSFGRRG